MGKPTGFLDYPRRGLDYRDQKERVGDWKQVAEEVPEDEIREQASRCMDCGIPFCSNPNQGRGGCPLGNIIPDWNDLVFRGKWEDALARLHSTNNFPEFTGSICPAPCEEACCVAYNSDAVTIKNVELTIVERGWANGWIKPVIARRRTGRSVAVVGSGPAGLAAAQQLCRVGHSVTVFEKNDRIGGLLRYGIPEFKMEKRLIDARLEQMKAEGVSFQTGVHVGVDLSVAELRKNFDAVLLCLGAEHSRDLPVEGRELAGVHYAMDFLPQQNKRCHGDVVDPAVAIDAQGKNVIVLGGGDTGSDCVGTSLRQGAKSVTSIELLERPPEEPSSAAPWPMWRIVYRSSSSHDEGGTREFALMTKRISGEGGKVQKIHGIQVRFGEPDETGRAKMEEVPGSEFEMDADLVLLAMGFLGPIHAGLLDDLGLEYDGRGNVAATTVDYATSQAGIFAAGDCRRGQSLVVWALAEGREAARAVDIYLMGGSRLQVRNSPGNAPV
ncbi:MAG TPA: glutamate synthase subunit beta [Myxococcales bacterium]|nr:glutamate synthase subunit beta [Myxococcales bacterium]